MRDNFEGSEVQTISMTTVKDIIRLVKRYAHLEMKYEINESPYPSDIEKVDEALFAVVDAITRIIAERDQAKAIADQANTIAADCKAQNERLVELVQQIRK